MTAAHRWRAVRHEAVHLRRLRRVLLRAELTARGIRHQVGGDAVAVHVGGLWFDVYAWLRDGRHLTWAIDHPHANLDDEHPGLEIGRSRGIRFRVDQLPAMWARYQAADDYPPWLLDHTG